MLKLVALHRLTIKIIAIIITSVMQSSVPNDPLPKQTVGMRIVSDQPNTGNQIYTSSGAHYLGSPVYVSFVVRFCSTCAADVQKAAKMRLRYHSNVSLLSFTMALLQVLAISVFLGALVGRGAPVVDNKANVDKVMEEMKERLKKFDGFPGVDADEYKRYWDEVLKNDPRMQIDLRPLFNFFVCIILKYFTLKCSSQIIYA